MLKVARLKYMAVLGKDVTQSVETADMHHVSACPGPVGQLESMTDDGNCGVVLSYRVVERGAHF